MANGTWVMPTPVTSTRNWAKAGAALTAAKVNQLRRFKQEKKLIEEMSINKVVVILTDYRTVIPIYLTLERTRNGRFG